MPTLNPYLTFSGNCREAMNFYKECLGGELTMTVVGESPAATQVPPHLFDKLSAGGNVKQPLHEMFFGLIGSFTDRFEKTGFWNLIRSRFYEESAVDCQ